MTDLAKIVRRFVQSHAQARRLVIAFSGGLDSTALLLAAAKAGLPQEIQAVHVNHGLSPNASAWQRHCESLCREAGVALTCVRVQVEVSGQGVEQAARAARMQALADQMQAGDLLLTAHHQQDQAETLLLRLARGAGWQGLAAIRPLRVMTPGWVGRPFLGLSKAELAAYVRVYGCTWVEDESNSEQRFDRNFLRHSVIPLLNERWPGFVQNSARCADLLAEGSGLLTEYALQDLQAMHRRGERVGESLLYAELLAFEPPRRHQVLRTWLQDLGYRAPPQQRLLKVESLLRAGSDREPQLNFGDCELRRFKDRLYCLPVGALFESMASAPAVEWDLEQPLRLNNGLMLRAEPAASGLRKGRYQVLPRSGQLRAKPHGRAHSQTLKRLLQEYALEPWLRPHVPLIFCGEQLAAVGDLWVEEAYWTDRPGEAVRLTWQSAQGQRLATSD